MSTFHEKCATHVLDEYGWNEVQSGIGATWQVICAKNPRMDTHDNRFAQSNSIVDEPAVYSTQLLRQIDDIIKSVEKHGEAEIPLALPQKRVARELTKRGYNVTTVARDYTWRVVASKSVT